MKFVFLFSSNLQFELEILSSLITLFLPPSQCFSAEHPGPFNDHLVIYLRHAGPGVVVGQAWQEGKDLERVPKKLFGEILMVKDFYATGEEEESSTNAN